MNGQAGELRLKDFNISDQTGFVPLIPPLRRLPGDYFSSWETVCADIPLLIKEKRIRDAVNELSERNFNNETLKSEPEWRRAYVVLSFISQAYLWGEGEAGVVDVLPKKLAVPWCTVSNHVSLPPVITYATTIYFNYFLQDPKGPMDADNMKACTTFTGTEDESWFYMIHTLMDLAAVPGLKAVEHAFIAMAEDQPDLLCRDLKTITQSVLEMKTIFLRMYERCAPLVFYLGFRPFHAGSEGIKAFPNGIVYEGVDSTPRLYNGASGGQNTAIPTIDIFLGVKHSEPELDFLLTMRKYQPVRHREFLEVLSLQPSVRDYIINRGDHELVRNFNMLVEEFGQLRTDHVTMVTRYVVNLKKHSVTASLDEIGTGGTPFMRFLKKVRDNTLAQMIDPAGISLTIT